MATMIKRSALPVLGRGQLGKPAISIRDNGQLAFSTAVSKILEGCVYAAVSFDEKTRLLQVQGFTKVPKGVEEQDLFRFGKPKKGNKVVYFSGASLLQMLQYDYKASGSQIFDADVDEGKHIVKITLPKGGLKPKPKQVRAKRSDAKDAKAASKANGKVEEPELEEEPEGTEPELEEVEQE